MNTPCRVTIDLNRYHSDHNAISQSQIDFRALELAATHSDDPLLIECLDDMPGNVPEFTAALHQLYRNILLSGAMATVPVDLVRLVERLGISVFENRAVRELLE